MDLVEFLRRQGEKLLPSGREKRLASDHSITVRGSRWYDHAEEKGGGPISFMRKFYGLTYPEAVMQLLTEEQGVPYEPARKQKRAEKKAFALPPASPNMVRPAAVKTVLGIAASNIPFEALSEGVQSAFVRMTGNAGFIFPNENGDHSVTVRGNRWYDHAAEQGGGPVSFLQKFYRLSYPEAVTRLLSGEQGVRYDSTQHGTSEVDGLMQIVVLNGTLTETEQDAYIKQVTARCPISRLRNWFWMFRRNMWMSTTRSTVFVSFGRGTSAAVKTKRVQEDQKPCYPGGGKTGRFGRESCTSGAGGGCFCAKQAS